MMGVAGTWDKIWSDIKNRIEGKKEKIE